MQSFPNCTWSGGGARRFRHSRTQGEGPFIHVRTFHCSRFKVTHAPAHSPSPIVLGVSPSKLIGSQSALGGILSWFVMGRQEKEVDTLYIFPREGILAAVGSTGRIQRNEDLSLGRAEVNAA